MIKKSAQTKQVAIQPEAGYLPKGKWRQKAVMPKLLPAMDIGEMDLYKGKSDGSHGVAQSNAGMGIGSRIDQNTIIIGRRRLDSIHQCPLTIGLKERQDTPKFCSQRIQGTVDLVKRQTAIDFRFTPAQHIQVWTMQNKKLHD